MTRTWFITGCSTGFGKLLARRALEAGENVAATARRTEDLADLAAGAKGRGLALKLDVTAEAEIPAAVATARAEFGRIDVLVNNAGYGYFATQEEFEPDEVRRMWETNVLGLARMTSAVLPVFREQRSGVVVNLSSIGGRMATPRGGFYQGTKWAVEAMSEALYYETSGFGVRVIVIEPGAYATDFGPRSARNSPHLKDPASPYAALMPVWTEAGTKVFVQRQDPMEVVQAIWDAVGSEVPFRRIPVGRDATALVGAREGRPDAEFIRYMHRLAGYGTGG